MADTSVSKTDAARYVGSNPTPGTNLSRSNPNNQTPFIPEHLAGDSNREVGCRQENMPAACSQAAGSNFPRT